MPANDQLELVLGEARRTLAQQQEDLRAIRDRSASLLSFAALAAAFVEGLGSRVHHDRLSWWTYVGAVAFSLVAVAAVYCHWPRTFIFANDPLVMLNQWDLENRDVDYMTRHLAQYLGDHYVTNRPKINRLTFAYQVALTAFAAEIVLLIVDLKGG